MNKEKIKLSLASMRLVDDSGFATTKFSEDGGTSRLEMTAYSGGVIKNHWYWGNLAIDLAGMSFPKKKFPILEDHDTRKKIGFATGWSTEGNKLTVTDSTFLDTVESNEFQKNSAAGFPYEASIYAKPTTIERVAEGDSVEVNGYSFKGPGHIWRKSILKEASVCTFGYDPNTKSKAMSESEEEVLVEYTQEEKFNEKGEEGDMKLTLEQFKADHAEVAQQFTVEVTAGLAEKFSAKEKDLEGQISALKEENTKLSEQNKELQKAEAIRTEQALKYQAESIFAEKFKESGLPDRLQSKIQKLVSYNQFVSDNKLDVEAFSKAIADELKDWTDNDGSAAGAVQGFGSSNKDTDQEQFNDPKESDAAADRMASYLK